MYIGIDIGGTTVKIGTFDNNLNLQNKVEITTRKGLSLLEDIDHYLNSNFDLSNVLGIGIGIPGFVLENGYILEAVNIGLSDINIEEYFTNKLNANVKVKVINDANAAALGEKAILNDDQVETMIVMTLGTGVGTGIIANNNLLIGKNGAAGEYGHSKIDFTYNFNCNCGLVGCLETVASATGFMNLYKYYENDYSTDLRIENVTTKLIFEASKIGNELALKVVDEGCKYLSIAIHNLLVTFDPDLIVLGGGVSHAKDYLLTKIKDNLSIYSLGIFNNTKIEIAQLGNDAGIYGLAYYIKAKTNN